MAPRRRLAVEHGGVARPAAGDHEPGVRPGDGVDVGDQRLDLARDRFDRRAPHGGRRGGGQAHPRALERVQLELERGRVAGSDGECARAELFSTGLAGPEIVEHLAQGEARPQSRQQRLASFGHVPADGHAARDAAPARRRHRAAGRRARSPRRCRTSRARRRARSRPPQAGDDVVVAGDGEHGACRAGQRGAVAAPRVGAGEDRPRPGGRRAGPPTRGRRRRARGRSRSSRPVREESESSETCRPPRRCTIHSATFSQRAAPRAPRCLSLASEHSALAGRPVRALKSGRSRASACASAIPRASCQAMGGCRTRPVGVEQHPGLGHAGDADAGHAALGRARDRVGRGADDGGEQRVGIDLARPSAPAPTAWAPGRAPPRPRRRRRPRPCRPRCRRRCRAAVRSRRRHLRGATGDGHEVAVGADGPRGMGHEQRVAAGHVEAGEGAGAFDDDDDREAGRQRARSRRPGRSRWALKKGAAAAGSSSASVPPAARARAAASASRARARRCQRASQPRPERRLPPRSSIPKPSHSSRIERSVGSCSSTIRMPVADRVGDARRGRRSRRPR